MKADLTRNTFDSSKHNLLVLMQQGRGQLDSDSNEQAAILLRYLQALATDMIGRDGGPFGNCGFKITPIDKGTDKDKDYFQIGAGHYYVDGMLCEVDSESIAIATPSAGGELQIDLPVFNGKLLETVGWVELFDADVPPSIADPHDGSPNGVLVRVQPVDTSTEKMKFNVPAKLGFKNVRLRPGISYRTQPDLPGANGPAPKDNLVYLDVWERHITCVEDDSIREVALGGPDTATRARIVWQVKITASEPTVQALNNLFQPENRGRLKAKAKEKSNSTDPCIIPPDARYQGPENQLYRVEIHTPGKISDSNPATFKWSRENGSVVFPIRGPVGTGSGTTTVTVAHLGRDDRFGLAEGDWVEIQDDDYVLQNRAGNLLQVHAIDRNAMQVTLSGNLDSNVGKDPAKHPLLRRWDHKQGVHAEGGLSIEPDGAALIEENSGEMWLNLEDGVQIQFQPAASEKNEYRTGDYWLIPARTETRDVEWPTRTAKGSNGAPVTELVAKPPDGIEHHYAPLAVITVKDGVIEPKLKDCRKVFTTQAKALS